MAWLLFTFVVAVGLESIAFSASERRTPQKRGTKKIKVPRRLKTAANTSNCNLQNQSIRMNDDENPRVGTDQLELVQNVSNLRQRVRDPPIFLVDWDNIEQSQAIEDIPQLHGRGLKSEAIVPRCCLRQLEGHEELDGSPARRRSHVCEYPVVKLTERVSQCHLTRKSILPTSPANDNGTNSSPSLSTSSRPPKSVSPSSPTSPPCDGNGLLPTPSCVLTDLGVTSG